MIIKNWFLGLRHILVSTKLIFSKFLKALHFYPISHSCIDSLNFPALHFNAQSLIKPEQHSNY